MIVWRISNYLDLEGLGGLRASARWHHSGVPIVYTASSPASALLEVLVHLELNTPECLPDSYRLLRVEVPDRLAMTEIDEGSLSPDWRNRVEETRTLGDEWLRKSETALLVVPSALVPHTRHYLINPVHPDSRHIQIRSWGSYPFDSRLFK